MTEGCWVVYDHCNCYDNRVIAVYNNEVEALRHALELSCGYGGNGYAVFMKWGRHDD